MKMTCDNDCTRAGWTEYILKSDYYDLHVSVAPETDLDGTFAAFCHDWQSMIRIHGCLFSAEQVEE